MKKLLTTIVMLLALVSAWAVPARREPFTVVQPNGDSITVRLVGDERWHAYLTEDGYLLKKNSDGYYCYATWGKAYTDAYGMERKEMVLNRRKAQDSGKRTRCRANWIRKHIPNLLK